MAKFEELKVGMKVLANNCTGVVARLYTKSGVVHVQIESHLMVYSGTDVLRTITIIPDVKVGDKVKYSSGDIVYKVLSVEGNGCVIRHPDNRNVYDVKCSALKVVKEAKAQEPVEQELVARCTLPNNICSLCELFKVCHVMQQIPLCYKCEKSVPEDRNIAYKVAHYNIASIVPRWFESDNFITLEEITNHKCKTKVLAAYIATDTDLVELKEHYNIGRVFN